MEQALFEAFAKGRLTVRGKTLDLALSSWTPHPECEGVFMKTLLAPGATEGGCSCHLVRVEPGQKIERHAHPASLELHEVLFGSGTCVTEQGDIAYVPGSMAVLAADAPHEVRAGTEGLGLLATFIPTAG